MRKGILLAAAALALVGALVLGLRLSPRPAGGSDALRLLPPVSTPAFRRAETVVEFEFPRDHGPHPDFQTEWWYYTGNLETADGRHFGFQLTFFRRALQPGLAERPSEWAAHQIYFAHFALTDVMGGGHSQAERFSRGAAGLAGAQGSPYAVWLEDWQVESLDATGEAVRLRAQHADQGIDLILRAEKPIVAHGTDGLSPKGSAPGNASYYLSFTRMRAEGRVSVGGQTARVTGAAWFDHEWSTRALPEGAVGWDWFSLQLDDGRELMFFQIRRADGGIEPASAGTLVEADGTAVPVSLEDVRLTAEGLWRSPETGAEYPVEWRLELPAAGLDLRLEPWLPDQEMRVSVVYWEGAVRIHGTSRGAPVSGNGYLELTGYAESIEGSF